jgi:hypothetical protein
VHRLADKLAAQGEAPDYGHAPRVAGIDPMRSEVIAAEYAKRDRDPKRLGDAWRSAAERAPRSALPRGYGWSRP